MNSILSAYFKIIKRLFPVNSQNSVVGLDISPSFCKAVEISSRNGRFELLRWAVEPVAEPDDKSLQAALSRVCANLGLQEKRRLVITSLGGKGTLVRYVDMPKMTPMDLRRTFAIESDKYFPFPKDTVYTDCHILETQDGNRKMSVLVSAVKKELLDGRIKALKDLGVDPFAVSLNSVAVANAFEALPPAGFAGGKDGKEFKACAVIDIGENGTNLMIIYAGMPRFNRDIFIGTQEIVKRVANILGVPPVDVRALLNQPSELKAEAQKGMDTVMAALIAEIRLSFDYFTTEKNLAVTRIFLTGEGSLYSGVLKSFKGGFDIPVEIWDPFAKLPVAAAGSSEGLKLHSGRLVAALGLALNEYD